MRRETIAESLNVKTATATRSHRITLGSKSELELTARSRLPSPSEETSDRK